MKKLAILALALVLFLMFSCSNALNSDVTSFDNYLKTQVIAMEDGAGYIVEGDIYMATMDQVKAYYKDVMDYWTKPRDRGTVNLVNGVKDLWNSATQTNITYCISNSFGTKKQTVINWMTTANSKWSAAGNIKFVYVPAQDSAATATNTKVIFDIRPATTKEENQLGKQGVLAFTFFPSYARKSREFVIFKAAWNYDYNYLFTHELGHTLGLRHEHIWWHLTSETTSNALLIVGPDTASIMYYNYLSGYTGNNDISAMDKQTLTTLYGAPK